MYPCHTHTHTWGDSLDRISADDRRELIHETAHLIHPAFSDQWYRWTPLHIREGWIEVLARILAGTQKELPASNDYIRTRLPQKLIDPLLLDEKGLFAFSKRPLSVNHAYLSATSYVAGLASHLGNRDIRDGLKTLKTMAEEEQDEERFMTRLSRHLNGQLDHPAWRKTVQLRGIERLLE